MLIFNEGGVYAPGATSADVAEFLALIFQLRAAEERYSEGDKKGQVFDLEGAPDKSEQALRITALKAEVSLKMAKLVQGCPRGPIPSDLDFAEDENGTLILVCSHQPNQHRYSLAGQRLN